MKHIGLITLAGGSTRFAKSVGIVQPVQINKSTYVLAGNPTILEIQINAMMKFCNINEIYLVVGCGSASVGSIIKKYIGRISIHVIESDNWENTGTAQSFKLGFDKIYEDHGSACRVTFFEGDILTNFCALKLFNRSCDMIAYTNKMIDAKESVIGYKTVHGTYGFAYDSEHTEFPRIEEATQIFNCANVYHFADAKRMHDAISNWHIDEFTENLLLFEEYFSAGENEYTQEILVDPWYNCNTNKELLAAHNNWSIKNNYYEIYFPERECISGNGIQRDVHRKQRVRNCVDEIEYLLNEVENDSMIYWCPKTMRWNAHKCDCVDAYWNAKRIPQ